VHVVTAEWPECLKACVEAEGGCFEWHYYIWKPKTIANYLAQKVDVLFIFLSGLRTFNRTYGKTIQGTESWEADSSSASKQYFRDFSKIKNFGYKHKMQARVNLMLWLLYL
jgi:hypothetical protein